MDRSGRGADSPRSLAALVAVAHLANDVPDAQTAETAAAARYVDDSIAAMPDVTRAGVRVASAAAYLALSVLGRSPYRRQSPEQRARSARAMAKVAMPVVSEFNRLTRGLALVGVYEQRGHEQRGGDDEALA